MYRRIDPNLMNGLYRKYNRKQYVSPDPLQFLYEYDRQEDREIVGLVASCLAYGRVVQILRSSEQVLRCLGDRPAEKLRDMSPAVLNRRLRGFRHRFATGQQMSALLTAARQVSRQYGSLGTAFLLMVEECDPTLQPALQRFVSELRQAGADCCGHLLADPTRGSACKRLHLYLRWMVRQDDVDPGGWEAAGAHRLIVPLDTHMHRIGQALGMIRRKQANLAAAVEMTESLKRFSPEDPVKYDFALSRLGIRADTDMDEFLQQCRDCE